MRVGKDCDQGGDIISHVNFQGGVLRRVAWFRRTEGEGSRNTRFGQHQGFVVTNNGFLKSHWSGRWETGRIKECEECFTGPARNKDKEHGKWVLMIPRKIVELKLWVVWSSGIKGVLGSLFTPPTRALKSLVPIPVLSPKVIFLGLTYLHSGKAALENLTISQALELCSGQNRKQGSGMVVHTYTQLIKMWKQEDQGPRPAWEKVGDSI
jgi:hypothetical protein